MPVKRWLVWLALLAPAAGCSNADRTGRAQEDSAATEPASDSLPVLDAGARKLPAVDEADSSFAEFRRTALVALQRRDTTFLYGVLSPVIKNSFGGDDSIAGFKRIWKMQQPDSSRVWDVLTRILTMGGLMQGESFVAPYVFASWPENTDPFQHVAVTDANVRAYDLPDRDARAVGLLSHSILPIVKWQDQDENGSPRAGSFAELRLPDGRSVWVPADQVYSPVGWRAFFQKQDGRWIMNLLVAGD